MSGLLFAHMVRASLIPDFGTGWTTQIAAASGTFKSTTDIVEWDPGSASDKALVTIDDEPAANSRVAYFWNTEIGTTASPDDPLYMVGRYTNSSNFYLFGGFNATGAGAGIAILKNVSGTLTELTRDTNTNMAASTRYALDVSNSSKKFFVDEVQQLSTTDNDLTSGKYGIAWGNFENATDDVTGAWHIDNILLAEIDDNTHICDLFMSETNVDPINGNHTPFWEGTGWSVEITGNDNARILGGSDDASGLQYSASESTSDGHAYSVQPNPVGSEYEIWLAYLARSGTAGSGDEFAGILARYTDANNYYLLGHYAENNNLKIFKNVSGTVTELASSTDPANAASEGGVLYAFIEDGTKSLTYYPNDDESAGAGSPTFGPWTISTSDNALTSAGKWGFGTGNLTGIPGNDIPAGTTTKVLSLIAREFPSGIIGIDPGLETDQAQAFTVVPGAVSVSIGAAQETDTAQAFVVVAGGGDQQLAIGVAQEIDIAQTLNALGGAASLGIGIAQETDEALSVVALAGEAQIPIGPGIEVDIAQAFGALPGEAQLGISPALETDTAQAFDILAGEAQLPIGPGIEIDSAQPFDIVAGEAQLAIGIAIEIDIAQAFGAISGNVVDIGPAIETDTAQALTILAGEVQIPIGLAEEIDEAFSFTVISTANIPIGVAEETDVAQAFTPLGGATALDIGVAVEIDTAIAFIPIGDILQRLDLLRFSQQLTHIQVSQQSIVQVRKVTFGITQTRSEKQPISQVSTNRLIIE